MSIQPESAYSVSCYLSAALGPTGIDRHRPLESRYGLAHTGPRLVPVQASWGRSGTGLNRLYVENGSVD